MRTRPTRLLFAATALLLLAGACSKNETTTNTTPGSTTKPADSTVEGTAPRGTAPLGTTPAADLKKMAKDAKLISSGKLTICSDIPYAPFEFLDEANDDKLTGFDVNLVDAMAEKLGLETDWKTTPFDSIIPALAAGNCDMIASATTITDERKEKVAFTDGYFDADQSLLILASDKDKYKKLADLKDKVIGVQASTTGADYAKAHTPSGATVKEYQGAEDLFGAIVSGEIQAVLQDFPVNKYRAKQQPEKFTVTETIPTGEKYGFAVDKDNPKLTAALNASLQAVADSGEYDDIYKNWFGGKSS
jgi:polar amino acid transport system substrate-binding protein